MDVKTITLHADSVAESLKVTLQQMAQGLADDVNEQNVRVSEALTRTIEKIDAAQAARDSAVVKDVAAKLSVLRQEIVDIGKERDNAVEAAIESAVFGVTASYKAAVSELHGKFTDEIAAACKSNFDTLAARIRGVSGGRA